MTRRLSRWGVGPSIAAAAGSSAALAGIATWFWPDVCRVSTGFRAVLLAAGIALLAVGAPMLVIAARAATAAYNSDTLATRGIFGVVRNPIYSAWIVFLLPGMVLLTGSWPLLLTPLVAYLAFKATIRQENDYLERRFGEAYRKYQAEVREILPRKSRRGGAGGGRIISVLVW